MRPALWDKLLAAAGDQENEVSEARTENVGPGSIRKTFDYRAVDHMIKQKASCIVLGGGGFIGTNLCRRLVAAGHRVRAFGSRFPFSEALGDVEWFQGDFSDASALAAAIGTFDVVYHLVNGVTPLSANLDMTGDVQKNIVASLGLLEICRKLDVSRVVFISSGGTIYGCPHQIPTPETAPTDPITAYGISKLAVEKYLALYEHLHRID